MNYRAGRGSAFNSLVLAAVVGLAGRAYAGWGVADITEIKERASVKRSGESAWETAEAFSILNPGDEIKTSKQGQATLYFWPRSEAVALGRESHLRLEKGRYVLLKGTATASGAARPSSGTVGTTILRGGAPDLLRARVFWMEGRLEDADREFEGSLRGGAHPSARQARKQLALLRKEKKRLEDQFQEAVEHLAKPLQPAEGSRLKVAIGQISYADSEAGSPFGEFLASQLSLALVQSPAFAEISRRELAQLMGEAKLSLAGVVDPSQAAELGRVKGVDAVLSGKYWDQENGISLDLSLVKTGTGEKLAAASAALPEAGLPVRLARRPENYAGFRESLKAWDKGGAGSFKVQVWADRGQGGVYREGESVTIFFKSERDCHLRLYHTDVAGDVRLIFPNAYQTDDRVQADRAYSVPNAEMSFEFKVSPPFGAEIIKAVASLRPFPGAEGGRRQESGFLDLGKASEENIGDLRRGISIAPAPVGRSAPDTGSASGAELSEATCVFTTAPEALWREFKKEFWK